MIRRLLTLALLALLPVSLEAATGTVMPSPRFYCLDANGVIIPSGRLFTYDAGTTTKRNTFTTSDLTVANANPTVCSASGQLTAFLTGGVSYKFVLAAAGTDDPPATPLWTVDNISSVPFGTVDLDVTGTAGEALTAGDAVYISDGTGGCGATAGRWYKTDADLTCASTTAQAIGFAVADIASAASGSIRIQGKVTGLAGLAAGSVYYISATAGAITTTAPTNQRAVGVADSGTTLVISSALTPAPASATQAGIVSLGAQTLGTGIKTVAGLTSNAQQSTTALLGGTTETVKLGGIVAACSEATDRAITAAVLTDSGFSCSIDAAALSVGNVIRVTVAGTSSGNQNVARQVAVDFGGTDVFIINQQTSNAASGEWRGVAEIYIAGAAAQRMAGNGLLASTTVINIPDYNTAAVAISGAITLKTQLNPASASETITQMFVIVEVF